MSSSNGVIRVGRKGLKKFAFGEDGVPFEVDVVVAFQDWIGIDEGFRDTDGKVKTEDMPAYHQAAVGFTGGLSNTVVTVAEALEFIAQLRDQYDDLAIFFQPKSRVAPDLRGSTVVQYSEEADPSTASKN